MGEREDDTRYRLYSCSSIHGSDNPERLACESEPKVSGRVKSCLEKVGHLSDWPRLDHELYSVADGYPRQNRLGGCVGKDSW